MSREDIHRIVVVGTSGCGKTTLAKQLSELTGSPAIDLDDVHWLPEWKERSGSEFVSLVEEIVSEESWIISGNQSRVRPLIWQHADVVVWIDLPRRVLLWRALKRSIRRIWTGEACCNGNYESLNRLLSRNSILLWIWNTYERRRRRYSKLFAHEGDDKLYVHLQSREEVARFIETLSKSS